MEKLVYVLWKRESLSDAAFREELLGKTAREFLDRGVPKLSVNVADEHSIPAQRAGIQHIEPLLSGTLSFWIDTLDDRAPFEEALSRITDRFAGYGVAESVPVRLALDVPLGEPTPAINWLSMITKRKGMGHGDFLAWWHEEHRKVAVETQCTIGYIRNAVLRSLTPGAPPWDGIVEEFFPDVASMLDKNLWYRAEGDPKRAKANLARMIESCQKFLDLSVVESHTLTQYVLR